MSQVLEPLWREGQPVGHQSPRESPLVDGLSAFLQVLAHQWFAARDGDKHLVGIALAGDAVQYAQEICQRHIRHRRFLVAVAAAVAAMDVAAKGTLPEQLSQRMLPLDNAMHQMGHFLSYSFSQIHVTKVTALG